MFKDRLAEEIRESGLTQKEVAERLDVSEGSVSSWLRGSEPRRPYYERLCALFPRLRQSDEPREAATA